MLLAPWFTVIWNVYARAHSCEYRRRRRRGDCDYLPPAYTGILLTSVFVARHCLLPPIRLIVSAFFSTMTPAVMLGTRHAFRRRSMNIQVFRMQLSDWCNCTSNTHFLWMKPGREPSGKVSRYKVRGWAVFLLSRYRRRLNFRGENGHSMIYSLFMQKRAYFSSFPLRLGHRRLFYVLPPTSLLKIYIVLFTCPFHFTRRAMLFMPTHHLIWFSMFHCSTSDCLSCYFITASSLLNYEFTTMSQHH